MTGDTEDQDVDETGSAEMDAVEARLEAALERIARRLDRPPPAPLAAGNTAGLAARLDGLIARVRETLDRGPGD